MGLFDKFKKKNNEIINNQSNLIENNHFFDEIYYFVSLPIQDKIFINQFISSRELMIDLNKYPEYVNEICFLNDKIIKLLAEKTNLALSDIINTSHIDCINGLILSSFYSGQADEYEDQLSLYNQKIPLIKTYNLLCNYDISKGFNNSTKLLNNFDKTKSNKELKYFLTQTKEGNELYEFLILCIQKYEKQINICLQGLHSTEEIYNSIIREQWDGYDECENKFKKSLFGRMLFDKITNIHVYELRLFTCVYMLGKGHSLFNIYEIFTQSINEA